MKFSTHSIHDQFQLPASFYQCFEQAKDLALYLQRPNVFFVASPKSGQGTLFEFKGSDSSESCRRRHEQARDSKARDCEEAARPRNEHRKRTTTKARELRANKQTTHAGRTNTTSDTSEKGFGEEGSVRGEAPIDNGSSSEDEELTGYFSRGGGEDRRLSKQDTSSRLANREPSSTNRRHGRKRSMEHEECPTIKRCCRPRLNFEKMQLNREVEEGFASSEEESHTNYFRPISPQDLTWFAMIIYRAPELDRTGDCIGNMDIIYSQHYTRCLHVHGV